MKIPYVQPGMKDPKMTASFKDPARLLAGQRALVTGANSGIGMAVAKALAEAGASVMLNYVSNEKVARRVVNDIEAGGGMMLYTGFRTVG